MLIAALLLTAAAPWETDIVAQAQTGRVLCAQPDVAEKTCTAIDRYTVAADGAITNVGEAILSWDPPVTLEVTSILHREDRSVCGALDLADLGRGRIREKGVVLPPARQKAMLEKLAAQMKPLAGRTVCEELRIEDGQLVKQGRMPGSDIQLPAKPVSWIDPAAGYTVGPR